MYLTGLSKGVYDQVKRSGKLTLSMPVQAYAATPVIGESTRHAYADATTWLVGHSHLVFPDQAAKARPEAEKGRTTET